MYRLCSVDKDLHKKTSRYRYRQTGVKGSYFLPSVQTGWGAHTTSFSVGIGGSFPGVSRSGCEADHSPSSRLRMSGATPPLVISFRSVQSDKICTTVASRSTDRHAVMSDFLKISQVFKILEGRSHTHKNTQNDSLFPKERKAVINLLAPELFF